MGRPHVITLDLNNLTEVKQAIRKIAKTKVRTTNVRLALTGHVINLRHIAIGWQSVTRTV